MDYNMQAMLAYLHHRMCVCLCVPVPLQVEEEVLRKYENDLLQKEHSGCAALLRDDKVSRE
jgi:hypothetical protein